MRTLTERRGRPKHVHGHGGKGKETPTYRTWTTMNTRCRNPRAPNYEDYGGRGIKVCERWQTFQNFLADMGERPVGASIDRIDNDRGYGPDNCRWATPAEQQHNKRTTKLTWPLVREIRGRSEHGESGRSIARRVGVNQSFVARVIRNEAWKEDRS